MLGVVILKYLPFTVNGLWDHKGDLHIKEQGALVGARMKSEEKRKKQEKDEFLLVLGVPNLSCN